MDAFAADGDDRTHIADTAEWTDCGITKGWSTQLARLIGGEVHQSGGNVWVVEYARPNDRFVVAGADGAEVHQSPVHHDCYYDGDWPEPEDGYWTD